MKSKGKALIISFFSSLVPFLILWVLLSNDFKLIELDFLYVLITALSLLLLNILITIIIVYKRWTVWNQLMYNLSISLIFIAILLTSFIQFQFVWRILIIGAIVFILPLVLMLTLTPLGIMLGFDIFEGENLLDKYDPDKKNGLVQNNNNKLPTEKDGYIEV